MHLGCGVGEISYHLLLVWRGNSYIQLCPDIEHSNCTFCFLVFMLGCQSGCKNILCVRNHQATPYLQLVLGGYVVSKNVTLYILVLPCTGKFLAENIQFFSPKHTNCPLTQLAHFLTTFSTVFSHIIFSS